MFFDPSLLTNFLNPSTWFLMLAGVMGGIIIGAIPGLTPSMAVALLVPVTFGMRMEPSLVLLVAVYVGGISGGLLPASLLNIPGTPASVATTFDAFPMVRRGEAGFALSLGIFSSLLGGALSFICLALLAPALGRFALRFGPYEYFSLVIFTLCCIASISRKSIVKSLLAGFIGVSLSLLGMSRLDGVPRMTFGFEFLENGLGLMPVLIGMYSIPQILCEISKIGTKMDVTEATCSLKDMFRAITTVFSMEKINVLRSSVIGVCIGILPGIGPALSNVVSYAQAKSSSPTPEKFGTGIPTGIVASESANNASTGGALIPLLSLGIPGDATTMMLLAAFTIHGVQPGPLLFREHADLVALVMCVFIVATILMFILQTASMRFVVKALRVPAHILYPIIVAMCIVGCYSFNSTMFDVWCFFALGVFGYILIKLDIPMLPLLLGLLLGDMAESQFRASWIHGGNSLAGYLHRPIALSFIGAAVGSMILSMYIQRKREATR